MPTVETSNDEHNPPHGHRRGPLQARGAPLGCRPGTRASRVSREATPDGKVLVRLRGAIHYVSYQGNGADWKIVRGAEADRRRPRRYGRLQPPDWAGRRRNA
jgi:hypothetical protein